MKDGLCLNSPVKEAHLLDHFLTLENLPAAQEESVHHFQEQRLSERHDSTEHVSTLQDLRKEKAHVRITSETIQPNSSIQTIE